MVTTAQMARHLRTIGINPVPTKGKVPVRKEWQSTIIPLNEISNWDNSLNVGAVCGQISGNLECIDFDAQGEAYMPWAREIKRLAPELLKRLVIEKTPSGGYHIWYRCPEVEIPGNFKLAAKRVRVKYEGGHEYRGKSLPAKRELDGFYIYPELIETRGDGGQAICFPSAGYVLIQPKESWVPPEITPDERRVLIGAARSFDQRQDHIDPQPGRRSDGKRPGDDFNERTGADEVLAILVKHGWKQDKKGSDGVYLTRPGKDKGISAALFNSGILHNFSSNAAPFEMEKSYTPFSVYGHLEHSGDFATAARELGNRGYGTPSQRHTPPAVDEKPSVEVSSNWESPIDIFDTGELGMPPWDHGFCPAVISDFAADTAERMGVAPSQIAGPAIAAMAGIIDDLHQLQMKRIDQTWRERPLLWVTVVGPSAAKKTPARRAVESQLKTIEAKRCESFEAQMAMHKQAVKEYKALKEEEREHIQEPEPPQLHRLTTQDSTVEALSRLLQSSAPNRKILVTVDELSAWLASFDAYRSGSGKVSRDRAKWLEAFEGGSQNIDRAKEGHTYVPNWSIALSGSITPEILTTYFKALHQDGLLQRFLLFHAENLGYCDRREDGYVIGRFNDTFRYIIDHFSIEKPRIYQFADDAHEYRMQFLELLEIAQELPNATPAFRSHIQKYDGIHGRLSLTYHLIEAASNQQVPGDKVSAKHAEMAGRLLMQHCLPVAARLYSQIAGESAVGEEIKNVAGYLLAQGLEEVSPRKLVQDTWSIKSAGQARMVLQKLEDFGWMRVAEQLKSGRPTKYAVNPAVHQAYHKRAAQERVERAEKQVRIKLATELWRSEKELAK